MIAALTRDFDQIVMEVDNLRDGPSSNSNFPEEAVLQNAHKTEEEYVMTVGRYAEVIKACKTLRARLLFTQAGLKSGSLQDVDDSDITVSLDDMEEAIHHTSIQEEALKLVKVSRLVAGAQQNGLSSEVVELLRQHASYQCTFAEKSEALRVAELRGLQLRSSMLEKLSNFINSLEADKNKLRDTSISEDPSNEAIMKKCEQYVKDIRFMQISISEMVSTSGIDLQENKMLIDIVKSLRNPVTSVEQFF